MTSINKSLQVLLGFELDKERKAAKFLQDASSNYQTQLQRQQGISDYRLDYMKKLQIKSQQGIKSSTFVHYQKFLNKLDQAALLQSEAILSAEKVVAQRRDNWLKQHHKVESIELLIEKQRKQQEMIEQKLEQKHFDEISLQRFVRGSVY